MKIKIVSPVNHDGVDLPVGKVVDLPDVFAEVLVDVGAAEAVITNKKAEAKE